MVKGSKKNVVARASEVAQTTSTEVTEAAQRRRFTAEYKLDVLRRADACTGDGDIGAILRKEGLYSSLLSTWRTQRDTGALAGLEPKKRGRKPKRRDPLQVEVEQLRRENARLQHRLSQAEVIIDVQKKVSQLLGIPLPNQDETGSNE